MKKVKLKVNDFEQKDVDLVSKKFKLTDISSRVLLNRNLCNENEIKEFLNPDFKYFEDAENYKDVQKGCKRILEAVNKRERILIYGDYDVDGVTSISQFVILLSRAGADISYYVPERETEGYGISSEFIQKLKTNIINIDLLITVDCGIAEVEKIKEITGLNKDVIVLDHHQCGDILPSAFAIINPKQENCPSKNKQLCAAGLSFKFLRYLNNYLKIKDVEDVLLELACLGTVADIVELKGDNRIITYNGLKKLNETKIIGIKKLIETSGIKSKKIESYHIGFILAPRINAAGRMSSAKKAIKLMLTQDEKEATLLAEELENLNDYRKQTEQDIFEEAVRKIEADLLYKKNILVVFGTNWHEGVLGIVSSKLTEKYDRPSVVISVKDGVGKGSARSMNYLNIYEAFKYADQYLVKYGGHKLAAGLTIKEENISKFACELNNYIEMNILEEDKVKDIVVDTFIECKDISYKLYNEITMFEPFGHGNPKPVFALENSNIKDIRRVGKNQNHLSFRLSDKNKELPVIGFSKISILEKILTRPSSYIVSIENNEYNGKSNLQLVLLNVGESEDFDYIVNENKNKILNSMINKSKSKIIKTDIFLLVEKLNKIYNTKTTAEEIICILKKNENIQYVLKNDILYIKK